MENVILNSQFFDSKLFLVPDSDETLKFTSGSNQKNLLVVYNKNSESEDNLELLTKILSAVHYRLPEDILMLAIEDQQPSSFTTIQNSQNIKDVLVFGIPAVQLGLHFQIQNYQAIQFTDCRFLFVDDLQDIATTKELKGKLWQCLQQLFLTK